MDTRLRLRLFLCLAAALTGAGFRGASAQDKADSLRKAYDFQGAVDWCQKAISHADSTQLGPLEEALLLSQNGLNMTHYCSQPEVISKHCFSREDFFLYYPMENHAWRALPNQLDSLASRSDWIRALYLPEDATRLYYSATGEDGVRNLYYTTLGDSLWSAPQLINEALTSASDEIFPILTRDGKSLYFASDGLYGMGGFDLYVSNWNEATRDWDPPVNLGFPYSSPYDDFLLIHSDDGRYTVFASNRACSPDSVCVYVLAYDSMPVRKSIETVDALKALCALPEPQERRKPGHHAQALPEDESVLRYIAAMDRVRAIRDSISRFNADLERLRSALKSEEDAALSAQLRAQLLDAELALPQHQKSLSAALKELQQIEMDFLASGIVIDPDKLQAEADREVVGSGSNYAFTKNALGSAPALPMEVPPPSFDYSFKILDVGQFAEDNTLPDGLVYQIQLFAISRKATEQDIKGLSPVFERIGSGGKRVYSVGLFSSYADVLSQLNKVKARGFKGAQIVAFEDGRLIPTATARKLEAAAAREAAQSGN